MWGVVVVHCQRWGCSTRCSSSSPSSRNCSWRSSSTDQWSCCGCSSSCEGFRLAALSSKLQAANESIRFRVGSLGELMHHYDKAVQAYENVPRHNPTNVKALTQIASIYPIEVYTRYSPLLSSPLFSFYLMSHHHYCQLVLCSVLSCCCASSSSCHLPPSLISCLISHKLFASRPWSTFRGLFRLRATMERFGVHLGTVTSCRKISRHTLPINNAHHFPNPKDPTSGMEFGIPLRVSNARSEHAEESFAAVLKMTTSSRRRMSIYFRWLLFTNNRCKYDQTFGPLSTKSAFSSKTSSSS